MRFLLFAIVLVVLVFGEKKRRSVLDARSQSYIQQRQAWKVTREELRAMKAGQL